MKRWMCAAFVVLAMSMGAWAKSKESSWLRVEDLSPDSPTVDVLVNGKPAFKSLSYQAVSDYVEIPGGKYDIQFVGAGGGKDQVIAGYTIKLKSGKYHSLVLFGLFKNQNVNVIELKDEPAKVREARLRFVHLSSDTPAVDVQDSGGNTVFKKISGKKSSKDLTLRPGSYAFEVRDRESKSQILKTQVKLEPGSSCTLFMIGDARDNSRQVVPVIDAGQTGKVLTTQEGGKTAKEIKAEIKAEKKAEKKAAKEAKRHKTEKAATTTPAD